jgi:predicted transcriptional regulator
VKNIYSQNFVDVREDDTLSHCLSLLEKEKRRVLVVLDQGRYKAVLARRWIIMSMLDPSATKVKTLMRSAPTVALEDSLSKVARLMIESGVMQLPVFRNEELLGCITHEDVIRGAASGSWGKIKVETIMTREPLAVQKDDPLGSVFNLFRQHGISHAPVTSNGKIVGIISAHDVIKHLYETLKLEHSSAEKINVLSIPLRTIMVRPVITIPPDTRLAIVERKMRDLQISSLLVTRKGSLQGIVTRRDLLEPIAQLEAMQPQLTVQFSARGVEIDGMQKEFLRNDFDSFTRKFGAAVKSGILFVYIKTHGATHKGKQLIHCRLQLRTPKASFFSSSEGWDVEQVFHLALHRLEIQVLKTKEIEYPAVVTRAYLEGVNFPVTGL